MIDTLAAAFEQVFQLNVMLVVLSSAAYGLFVGAIPGLSATMAVALLVPVTFFMQPIPAIAAMVTATAMAIFSGDVPGCLLRIPGTPASAAYADEAHLLTKKGKAELALGGGLVCSCIGGLFGTAVLIIGAPALAELALRFSSYEYFWLVLLGLTCAIFIASADPLKGFVSLFLGLAITSVGMGNPTGYPRFTFGSDNLLGGLSLIPIMVGMFAVSEVLRYAIASAKPMQAVDSAITSVFGGVWKLLVKYPKSVLRGSVLGTIVGALPGAGADIAAYMSYAVSKKFSREPEKFGTGHPEGIVEASAANNGSLAGAWIPALVFGIPGDSITAIVIGVLYMKDLNPGPMIFINNAVSMYSIFIVFIVANLLMLPLGYALIKLAKHILRTPRQLLMPLILVFCIVGSYAINNSIFDVGVMLAFGVLAYLMEENGFPIAPTILGVVLGTMLEENYISSVIKSDGNIIAFFERPIAGTLGVVTILIWTAPLLLRYLRKRKSTAG
ncbi:tripartite tricarboxylate transporter permease [Pollutimonas thiosulfatoxidans]|uniref:C4-dicarboxylate ABC transporter permease n=1 Tax=Pollutimonas thiosulfatoxidans TaxID=2028345 RepID=A0A410GG76_9BURK|nr:tripartite tricarboxylate transporter permease [Pollutimonas thiosulfatoxidans]MBF6618076.1 tripartite tricarboxylate transporter permease [Candidimonas sp.]QAA95269.1 C4-dicarboxylate ABC transporter permease [Pollutimonas thiosulfatoxidans]